MTPLQNRVIEALKKAGGQREYSELMFELWPPEQHPRAYRYRTGGGPFPIAMNLGGALNKLERMRAIVYDRNRRVIRLRENSSGFIDG